MNRLAPIATLPKTLLFATPSKTDHSAAPIAAAAMSAAGARGHRPIRKAAPGIALFAPVHYERRYRYPLLVWLHGDGSSERELRRLMPNVSVRNYVGAAARGLPLGKTSAQGYAWQQTTEGIDAALDSVGECIAQAQRQYQIHSERVFLAGRGAGGTMAVRLALQFDLPLAGVISLGGALPRGNCPLVRLNETRQLPMMLMCCRDSESYPSHQVADDLRLLHSAGCSLSIREYLCGDELFTDMFADMDEWVMGKVCPQTETASAQR